MTGSSDFIFKTYQSSFLLYLLFFSFIFSFKVSEFLEAAFLLTGTILHNMVASNHIWLSKKLFGINKNRQNI